MSEGDSKGRDGREDNHDAWWDALDDEKLEEEILEAWAEAERDAAQLVARGLAGVAVPQPSDQQLSAAADGLRRAHARGSTPARWMLRAAGIERPGELADAELLVAAVAATISMVEDPGLPPDEAASIMTLELADWVGAVLGAVRAGPGSVATPSALVDHGVAADEVDAPPLEADEREIVEHGFFLVLLAWDAAGVVVDGPDDARLTPVGAWVLPRAVAAAWAPEGDAPPTPQGSGRSREAASPDDAGPAHQEAGADAAWVERSGEDLEEWDLDEVETAVVLAVRELLTATGPLFEEEVADRLIHDGVVDAAELESMQDLLWDVPGIAVLRDRRLAYLPGLVEGRTFTHRVTELEVAEQRLEVMPDLPLTVTFLPPLPLPDGRAVRLLDPENPFDERRGSSLFGPPGWLPAGLAAGDLVACRVEDGALVVTRALDDDLDDEDAGRTAQHLADTFATLGGTNVVGGPLDMPELVLETVTRFPATFRRATAPLVELLDGAGLAHDDAAVFDPDGPDELDPEDGVRALLLAEVYGLDEMEAQAVGILEGVLDLCERDEIDELPADLAGNLVPMLGLAPEVIEALVDLQFGTGPLDVGAPADGVGALERFERVLRPHARGSAASALDLVVARVAEARGETLAAETALRRAARDPACSPAHEDLAWYLEDRGDVAGALSQLRRAGVPGDDLRVTRLEARRVATRSVGRNDPCPCGSGRKFKKCCDRLGGGPLPDRVGWLLDKVMSHLTRPVHRRELLPLIEARAGDSTDERRLANAVDDGVVVDAAMFEGGGLERFLVQRGVLLPDDERELATSWVGTRRSLYEIVEVDVGEGFELLDLRSGDRLRVRERAASRQLAVGETLFARVLPDGHGRQLSGGVVHVPVQHRESALGFLDAGPQPAVAICAWVAALEAPPTLLTMEGEPTVLCTAEYRVGDPDQAAAALAERYEALDDDGRFVEWVEVEGQRWGRGQLALDGDRLWVETNAEARLERLMSVIEEVVEGAELRDESRRPMAEVAASTARDPDASGRIDPEDLPEELREFLDAEIARREEAWVDESIPMLGGLTPREARDDPTRREQLLAFLDEVEREARPGGMRADRIRGLLGISRP